MRKHCALCGCNNATAGALFLHDEFGWICTNGPKCDERRSVSLQAGEAGEVCVWCFADLAVAERMCWFDRTYGLAQCVDSLKCMERRVDEQGGRRCDFDDCLDVAHVATRDHSWPSFYCNAHEPHAFASR